MLVWCELLYKANKNSHVNEITNSHKNANTDSHHINGNTNSHKDANTDSHMRANTNPDIDKYTNFHKDGNTNSNKDASSHKSAIQHIQETTNDKIPRHQSSAALWIFPAIERIKLGSHAVQVVVRVPAERNIQYFDDD